MDGTYITDVVTKEQVHFGRGSVVIEDCDDGGALWTFVSARGDSAFWRRNTAGLLAWIEARRADGSEIEVTSSSLGDRGYGAIVNAKEVAAGPEDIGLSVSVKVDRTVDRVEADSVALGLRAGFEPDGVWRPDRAG